MTLERRTARAERRPRARSRGELVDPRALETTIRRRTRAPVERPVEKLLLVALHCVLATLLIGSGGSLTGVAPFLGLTGALAAFHYLLARHLAAEEPGFVVSLRRQVGLYATILLLLAVARVLVAASFEHGGWLNYLIPLPMVALVARIVQGQRFAIEVTTATTLLLGLLLDVQGVARERLLPLLAVLFAGSVAAAVLTTRIRKRSKLVKVGAAAALVQVAVLVCFQAIAGRFDRIELVFVALQGIGVGYLVSGSLPLIELLFDVLTDISLLELCNQNDQPLLKKLQMKAPGTAHHSFLVGVLAETAAESVGANPLLCRAGAYYHDVGKMVKPGYFAENMGAGPSPHDALEPAMSCLVICAHTKDGLEIGRRYGLHRSILEFIPTHHGTSLVRYFFHKAVQRSGPGAVSESAFRYPGPRPRTKETGLVNLADAVEAATRSLESPSPNRLRNKVREIILGRMMDRQLDETGLTFADLSRIEDEFVRVLVGIHHARPQYPETAATA